MTQSDDAQRQARKRIRQHVVLAIRRAPLRCERANVDDPAMHRNEAAANGARACSAPATATAPSPHGAARAPITAPATTWDHGAIALASTIDSICIAAPAQSAAGSSAANSSSRLGAAACAAPRSQPLHPARARRDTRCATATAARKRNVATAGPKTSQVAAAAGSDRADGPVPQPRPKKAVPVRPPRTRQRPIPASKNGVASKSELADVASAERSAFGDTSAAIATTAAATTIPTRTTGIPAPSPMRKAAPDRGTLGRPAKDRRCKQRPR